MRDAERDPAGPEDAHEAEQADAAWEGNRKGAIFGTVLGMNLWVVILAIDSSLWPEIGLVLAFNVAMTLALLVTMELAARVLGPRGMLPILFGMILFAIGSALLLVSVALDSKIAESERLQETLIRTGSVMQIPVWIGPIFLLASLVPFWIGYRAIRASRAQTT